MKASSALCSNTRFIRGSAQIDWRRALLLSWMCVLRAAHREIIYACRAAGARALDEKYAGGRFWRVPHSMGGVVTEGGKVRSIESSSSLNFAIKIAWGFRVEVSEL